MILGDSACAEAPPKDSMHTMITTALEMRSGRIMLLEIFT